MNPSKLLQISAAALSALATTVANAQSTATTTPVGFINVTIPAAASASVPNNAALSIPLYKPADFVGVVATIDSANSFTLAGAAWTPGQFTVATAPRLVRVKSGPQTGKLFPITVNTANQLTVDLTGTGVANINTVISTTAPATQCEIVPANTLGNVFGNATTPPTLKAGATPTDADNVLLWNGSVWDTYYWTGTVGTPNNIWKRIGNTDRSNVIIYPEDGVFVVHKDTTTAVTISFLGTVPSTSEQSEVASGSTFLANRFPTDTTLGALGLQSLPGWVAGATPASADNVLIWNSVSGTWDTYFWTGSVGSPINIWKRVGNTDRSSTPIPAGTAVFITHAGSSQTLAQSLPYTP